MIELLEGRLGGGKTYMAVSAIITALGKGRDVFTNIEVDLGKVSKVTSVRGRYTLLDSDDGFFELPKVVGKRSVEEPVLIAWDEIQLWLGSRDYKRTMQRAPWLMSWLTQSRKLGLDFMFISQDRLNVDAQVRRLLQYVWKCRDLRYVLNRMLGFTVPDSFRFLRIQTDYAGGVIGWSVVPFRQEIADCYSTAALLKPIDLGTEVLC